MTKKAKKRIKELCGLDGLSKEDRLARARDLLDDDDLKQYICHQLLGTTFRDIEKVLKEEIANSKAKSDQESIYDEIEKEQPEKLDSEHIAVKRKLKPIKRGYYTSKESLELIEADSHVVWDEPKEPKEQHSFWSEEEIWALINSCYDNRNFSK